MDSSGVRFRRQAPRGSYVVDFLCHSPKLIVELDGGQHSEQKEYDEERSAWFQAEGRTVLRFWNYEVNANLDGVLEIIRRFIEDHPQAQRPRATAEDEFQSRA